MSINKKVAFWGPEDEEQPGEFPFTHGIYPNMYRGQLWSMRQYAGFASAEESNKRYHYLLEQGVMGLSIAFDLPTQTGYDSNHALAEGEVEAAATFFCAGRSTACKPAGEDGSPCGVTSARDEHHRSSWRPSHEDEHYVLSNQCLPDLPPTGLARDRVTRAGNLF